MQREIRLEIINTFCSMLQKSGFMSHNSCDFIFRFHFRSNDLTLFVVLASFSLNKK